MTGILAAVVLELMRESLTGTHCRYREVVDGVASEEYVTAPCSMVTVESSSPGVASHGLMRSSGRLLRRTIRNNTAYDFDATTGALVRTIPLWFNGKPARVFDPNPVAATNDSSLRDRNDAANAVPESAYRHVEVAASPFVKIVDTQAPFIAPIDLDAPSLEIDREADGFEDVSALFHIDRTQRYLQSLGYSGAKQIAPYAIETDTHAAGGADNSFFQPSNTQPGRGALYFGTGGTDDAEDADLVVHEYGHAIQEWIAPGTFLGTFASQSRALSEGFSDYWAFSAHLAQRAAARRDLYCFADWDARCGGDDASQQCGYPDGADCLRRLDTPRTMADYDRGDASGTEHRNSAIWSGALIAIFNANMVRHGFTEGKRISDTLAVEALFGTPPNPTFATMAQRVVNVDRLLFGGVHADVICAAMSARGIVAAGACSYTPRGELTLIQSSDRSVAIPENNTDGVTSRIVIDDARAIERVFVRVDIAHPSRGDLRVVLTAPDGTSIVLQQISFERTADVHATFGLDAAPFASLDVLHGRSAAGTWTLNVSDQRALDVGTLESWGLLIQFAGDAPRSARPATAANAQILPIVAHTPGANGSFFRTDVYLTHRGASSRTATLIFTPSETDGRTTFSAAKVVVPPNQVVALRDVLPTLFATSGSGNLVIDGNVLVSARLETAFDGGTVGYAIEPVRGRTGTLRIDPIPGYGRANAGIAEVAGVPLAIDVRIDGVVTHQDVPAYSYVQFALPTGAHTIEFPAATAIAAYVSVVDDVSSDSLYLEAGAVGTPVAPGIRAPGANGTAWQTDFVGGGFAAFIEPSGFQVTVPTTGLQIDALGTLFDRTTALGILRVTPPMRVVLRGREHTLSVVPESGAGTIFPIEHSTRFRTNLTLIGDAATVAHVTVYDASGNVIEAFERSVDRNRLAQFPLLTPVVDGRVVVDGEGLHAWASLIDNATGDATILGAR